MFKNAKELTENLKSKESTQLNQLAELLEMQLALDETILKEKELVTYPENNISVALFAELGELLNEFPTHFKHWKDTAIDDREKGLVEYVDCLHFALSLTNAKYNKNFYEINELVYDSCKKCKGFNLIYIIRRIAEGIDNWTLPYLFELGNYLGFSWEEIYTAYKEKNQVNYERLENGY